MKLLQNMAMFAAIFAGIVVLWAACAASISRFEDWLRTWPGGED